MNMDEKYPRGIEVVVGPYILNDNKQILLTISPKWKGIWVPPGGHVEVGETMEDALVRETKEELGVEICDIKPLSFSDSFYSFPMFPRNAHFIFHNFVCKIKSGDLSSSNEVLEFKWFDVDDALKLNIDENTRTPLEKIRKMIENCEL